MGARRTGILSKTPADTRVRAYCAAVERDQRSLAERAAPFGMRVDGDFDSGVVWFRRRDEEWRFSFMSEARAFLTGLETPRE